VLALPEGAVGDPFQQLGVVAKGAHVVPGDLVRAVVEVIVAEHLEPSKHRVDLGFLETKAARASSLDLAIWLCSLGLIFVLSIGDLDESMNASSSWIIKRRSRSESAA
jgi:hypothetical protein